jgi:hypothetical protein
MDSDRLERILMMVYVVPSYWACFGLLSSTYKTMDKVQNKPNSSVHEWIQFKFYFQLSSSIGKMWLIWKQQKNNNVVLLIVEVSVPFEIPSLHRWSVTFF